MRSKAPNLNERLRPLVRLQSAVTCELVVRSDLLHSTLPFIPMQILVRSAESVGIVSVLLVPRLSPVAF